MENPELPANTPPACAGNDHGNDTDQGDALLASVPVRRFLEAFYPTPDKFLAYGTVLERTRRREDVLRQLHACLTDAGTKLDKHATARAYDLAHLETCCAAVGASKMRDPDKAIHVLLIKLSETWAETRARSEKPAEIPRQRSDARAEPVRLGDILPSRRVHA